MRQRRAAAVAAIACVTALLAAGCSDDKAPKGQGGAGASASASATPSGEPAPGGTLRVGIQRPRSLDPAAASPGSQSELLVADLLFDGLSAPGKDGDAAVPALATWTVTADQKTWTFSLRDGATFANGRAV